MSARRERPAPRHLPLSDAVLARLTVAKAKAVYRVRHPDPERELRDLERQPVTLCYLSVPADLAGDET